METENKHTSILMEKINLYYNIYIYKFVCVIKGNFIEESNVFIDEYDNSYYLLNDADMMGIGSEESHCIGGFYTDEQLKNSFPAETKFESIKLMEDYYYDTIWLGFLFDEQQNEISIIGLPIENVEKKFDTEVEYPICLDSDISLITKNDIDKLLKINDLGSLKKALQGISEKLSFPENVAENYENEGEEEKFTDNIIAKIKTIDKSKELYKQIDIDNMYKYITERVIGQNEAIKQIITIFIMNKIKGSENVEEELTKVLLTGPTGCGKTLIIETMLEYLTKVHEQNFPMAKIPTSQLTVSGYVGTNLEDIISVLVKNTFGNFSSEDERIKYAELNGIVFLDELDKKGSVSNGDVSGRGVLNSLLEFLTGSDYIIGQGLKSYKFNTRNLSIFAAGAFSNVYDSNKKSNIGFNSENNLTNQNVSIDNFINEGMMPAELMGRFHKIVNLNPITKNILIDILQNSKKSTLLSSREKLRNLEVDLTWDESFINKIVEEAFKRKLGARSLKSLVEESLFEVQWNAIKNKVPAKIKVTAETVDNPKKYILSLKNL